MTPDDRLTEVFERGLNTGFDNLTPTERELYLIQEFILDHEMGFLSGYFYNHLPDLGRIDATVNAMKRHGLPDLANLLAGALVLFEDFVESDCPGTWREVLSVYDPSKRLGEIDEEICTLKNYGLAQSSIT